MSKRVNIKTTIKQAADYWSRYVDECDLSVDWSEAETHCWRCGCEKNLQRCHIIPDALGGKDEPANIVLLCARCHAEGPNVTDAQIMWDWIKAYKVPIYETFWNIMGAKEYEFIYKQSFLQDLNYVLKEASILNGEEEVKAVINEAIQAVCEKAGVHFGQPYFNTATMAGLYRMMLKDLAETYKVPFPSKQEEQSPQKPWWAEWMGF